MTAERLMFLGGVIAFLLALWLVRQRAMREKYALLWLFLGLSLAVLGIFPDLLKGFAHVFRLAYPTAALFGALTVIYLFSMGVTVSVSRLHRQVMILLQDLAILRSKVAELERRCDETHRRG